MGKKAVLFATVGTTDLQVVVEKGGEKYRAAIGKNRRAFHEWAFEQGHRAPVDIDEFYAGLTGEEGSQSLALDWNEAAHCFNPTGSYKPLERDGKILFTPPKLALVAESLRKDPEIQVVAVILFNTRRSVSDKDPDDFRKACSGEPTALGPLLSLWLTQFFGLEACGTQSWDIGLDKAGWVDILDGKMMQEGPGRDAYGNREAMARIDKAAATAASWDRNAPLWSYVSVGGGMTLFKEPVKACVAYHFQGRTRSWQVPQYSSDPISVWGSPDEDLASPVDSFRGRNRARQLILKGDFAGAFHAVEHLINDQQETQWIAPLEHAANYLAGNLYPDPGLPPYLYRLADTLNPRCLLAAMRTEAALSSGMARLSEAVAWTCTFFDAALLDFMERLGCVVKLDDFARLMTFDRDPPQILTDPIRFAPDRFGPGCLRSRGGAGFTYGYSTIGYEVLQRWLDVISVQPLANLNQALDANDANGRRPRDYRNIIMHSAVPRELMSQLAESFSSAGLWNLVKEAVSTEDLVTPLLAGTLTSENDVKPGTRFLSGNPVSQVLQKLGFARPAELYEDLVYGLIQEMDNHEIR